MKKALLVAITTSLLLALTGCVSDNDFATLEKRVTALENGTIQPNADNSTAKTDTAKPATSSELDVLTCEFLSAEKASIGGVEHKYKITNIGSETIESFSAKFVFYDSEGNMIAYNIHGSDSLLESQKAVYMSAYGGDKTNAEQIVSSKVTSYSYYLLKPNANGNNYIEVNCETGKTREAYYEK